MVDVSHASVNPLDIWISRGNPGAAAANLPWIPGTEGAGTYEGRPVLIRGGGHGVVRQGLFASKAAASPEAIVPLPAGVDPAVASAIGVAGVTAWNCVNVLGETSSEDRVLVLGASGGVGSLIVQLAKAKGATVWGQTTSAAKVPAIEALGADHAVVTEADGLVAAVTEPSGRRSSSTASAARSHRPPSRRSSCGAGWSSSVPARATTSRCPAGASTAKASRCSGTRAFSSRPSPRPCWSQGCSSWSRRPPCRPDRGAPPLIGRHRRSSASSIARWRASSSSTPAADWALDGADAAAGATTSGACGRRSPYAESVGYVPAADRYQSMTYRRCGRSGLKLPAISLGLWHNFGHDRPFATQQAICRRAFDLRRDPLRPGQQLRPAVRRRGGELRRSCWPPTSRRTATSW